MGKMKEIDIDITETLEFISKRLKDESAAYCRFYYKNLILELNALLYDVLDNLVTQRGRQS